MAHREPSCLTHHEPRGLVRHRLVDRPRVLQHRPGHRGRLQAAEFDQIMEPQAEAMREAGADPDGLGHDNFSSNANNIDFERANLAACDFRQPSPPGAQRPVITIEGRP